MEMNRIINVSR